MHNILISADSRFPISRPKIKKAVTLVLKQERISSDSELSILVCGTRKARQLAKKYLRDSKPHNVLSFPQTGKVGSPAGQRMILGDIVICYPLAQQEANRDNLLVDTKINELVTHGLLGLLGEHHSYVLP